jgi:hypothetical protein
VLAHHAPEAEETPMKRLSLFLLFSLLGLAAGCAAREPVEMQVRGQYDVTFGYAR